MKKIKYTFKDIKSKIWVDEDAWNDPNLKPGARILLMEGSNSSVGNNQINIVSSVSQKGTFYFTSPCVYLNDGKIAAYSFKNENRYLKYRHV